MVEVGGSNPPGPTNFIPKNHKVTAQGDERFRVLRYLYDNPDCTLVKGDDSTTAVMIASVFGIVS